MQLHASVQGDTLPPMPLHLGGTAANWITAIADRHATLLIASISGWRQGRSRVHEPTLAALPPAAGSPGQPSADVITHYKRDQAPIQPSHSPEAV